MLCCAVGNSVGKPNYCALCTVPCVVYSKYPILIYKHSTFKHLSRSKDFFLIRYKNTAYLYTCLKIKVILLISEIILVELVWR